MKRISLLFIVSFFTTSVFSQDTYFKWAKQFAGTSTLTFCRSMAIETDTLGNVYTVGIFSGTVDFDPGPGVFNFSPSSTDVFISKLDASGNFLWAKQLTGSFGTLTRSFSLDKNLNIYVTGTFQAQVDFDPGPGVFNMIADGTADVFILKLTTDGDFLWAKKIGASTVNVESYGTTSDSFGNIYFSGSYKGALDFDPGPGTFTLTSSAGTFRDAYVCKLDAAGNFLWAVSMGAGEQEVALGISADKSDNIYVTGFFRTTVDFDPGPAVFNLVSNGSEDMFILKLNATGSFIWAKAIGGNSTDHMYKAVFDDAGNIYTTGFFRATADFDPGPAVFNLSSVAGESVFVLKLDAAGNFTWAKAMGGVNFNNWGYDIALDRLGNIYTTGFFIGPSDFDPGPGTFMLNSSAVDIFISKLDNNGNFVWAKGTGAGNQDQGLGITVDRFLNIYTTGHFGATTDFDLEAPTYYLTAIPVSDAFVLKVGQCLSTTATITASACKSYTLNGQTYTTSGTYRQVIYNAAGCDSTITLQLDIRTEIFNTVNAVICPGQSYYAGGANQTVSGIYKDTVQTAAGCDSIITTHLTVNAVLKPDLGPDRGVCIDAPLSITPGIFSNYLWQDNSTRPSFIINSVGTYWVRVYDANNCSATDTLKILSIDTKPKDFLPADVKICHGNAVNISVPGYKDYLWSTGETSGSVSLKKFGTFYLTVKDHNDCSGTDTIIIRRADCIPVGIPNAFTPNKDGKNDIFKPTINQAIQYFSFTVFNRYGEKIFETKEYGKGWDGTYKGKDQTAGSYVYLIKFISILGWESENSGPVLLIR
jgi:gliding motility-associated-like protein